MKRNKKIIIICAIIILIIAIIFGIYYSIYFIRNKINDSIRDSAYIDIWKDVSMDLDIALELEGSGLNKKSYLGKQPLHYIINKDGEIYTYLSSSYINKITGISDPATVKYIKTLSQSDLEKIEEELKVIIENNSSNSISWDSIYWYIKINGKLTRVDVNVETQVLNNYI